MEKEIFKDIPEYEGLYQISNLGRVKSLEKFRRSAKNSYRIHPEKILKQRICNTYFQVALSKNTKKKYYYIHTLLLETFIKKRPKNYFCRHLDGNPLNNNLNNLKWGTRSENAQDSIKHNTFARGEKHCKAKLTEKDIIEIRKLLKIIPASNIAKRYKVHRSTIYKIKYRIIWYWVD